jgi:homocysteine S-methyltransferase
MAPPCAQSSAGAPDSDVDILGRDVVFKEFAAGARGLADSGADLILAEYIGHIADLVTCADACATSGLPVFLGVRHVTSDGGLQYGETVEELASELEGHDVAAVLLMCSWPEDISATLPGLRESFDGPIGAYPNIGYEPLAPLRAGSTRGFIERGDYTPDRLAEFAGQWVEMGAQIVGGCCASGPEHIDAMRPVVKG